MNTAERLAEAWNEASEESGFHAPGEMNLVKAEKCRDRFYELFFQKTALHPSYVVGLFRDWNKLSHDEVKEIHEKQGSNSMFCAYLAEIIQRKFIAHTQNVVYLADGPRSEDGSN